MDTTTLVTIVRYHDQHHAFLTTAEEQIRHLLAGAVDHFPTRRYLPHGIIIDGDQAELVIDEDTTLGDTALRHRLKSADLRLVELNEAGRPM